MDLSSGASNASTADESWQVDSASMSGLNIALVFDKDLKGCGHKLPFNKLVDRIRQTIHAAVTCPVCDLPVTLVRDEAATDPSSTTVNLKYGKLAYELTIPDSSSNAGDVWLSFSSANKGASNTVQARLAQVLGLKLTDMKILHKGKVLYPSSHATDEEISEVLLSHHQTLHGKPQLLVMGTVEEKQLPKNAPTGSQSGLWNKLMNFSQRVIVSTLNYSVSIVLSVLQGIYNFATPLLKRSGEQSDASRRRD